jgi:hypothetical protein
VASKELLNNNASAEQILEQLFSDLQLAETNVERAQQRQQHYTNLHRQHKEYKVGDKVLLSTTDLRWKMKVTPKLLARYIGPFVIKRVLSPLNYELDLPSSLSIHPVFHISKLREFVGTDPSRFPNRSAQSSRPPANIVNDNEEYEVEAIRDSRIKRWTDKKMYKQYLVKWKGYPEWENTWEWEDTLVKSKDLVDEYESSQ